MRNKSRFIVALFLLFLSASPSWALTVLELRDVSGGPPVQPTGYYDPGDSGAGPLRVWDAQSTCTDPGIGAAECIKPDIIPTLSPGRWVWKWNGPVSVKWFGAKGDGTTDDTVATRKALDYAGAKTFGAEVVWTEGIYYYPTTIYIPTTAGLKLTSEGAILKGAGAGTGTIFETGAQTSSTGGTSNWTFNEAYNHCNQSIMGFKFIDCKYGMKLWNFLEGCKANDNFGSNLVTLIYASRSFYGDFKNNRAETITQNNGAYGYEDAAYRFESFVNVQSIEGNSVSRAKTGFYFTGGVSGLLASNNSAEGCNRGLMIEGNVYGAEVRGWYFEGNDRDVHIESAAYKDGLIIDGCWLNSADAVYSESWRSGELGKNNYYGSNGSVNISNSHNSVNVWLPRVTEGMSTAYSSVMIPANWTINAACKLHPQETRYIDAIGPSGVEAALSEDYTGNQRVPRYYVGTSGFNVTPPAYTTVDASVLGSATIDTKLVYHDRECGIRFDLVIRQGGVVVDRLAGWISGTTVFRDDASAKTVVASNNGGYYRLVISGYAASALTVFGGIRIL